LKQSTKDLRVFATIKNGKEIINFSSIIFGSPELNRQYSSIESIFNLVFTSTVQFLSNAFPLFAKHVIKFDELHVLFESPRLFADIRSQCIDVSFP
jgi:hypothetical protein